MKNIFKAILAAMFAAMLVIGTAGCGNDGGGGDGPKDNRPATPEAMGNKTAIDFLSGYKMGWNLGNSTDAVKFDGTGKAFDAVETAAGNPLATQALFNGVKESGFDIVRITCTWIGHIGPAPDYKVSEARLQRIAEIVNYAHNAGMAAIINIHHDGNNSQGNQTTWGFVDMPGAVSNAAKKTEIQNEISKVWTQIAEYFKNYGDYLIFETLNEVHNGNWGNGASAAEQTILFDWNQAALNAIRATGGNNAKRYVAVPGLGATEPPIVVAAYNAGKLLPNDPGNGTSKLIVSVHYYDPAQYTVAGTTDQAFQLVHTWGTTAEKNELTHNFESLKSTFFDKGIAVYAGEWGAKTNVRATMSQTIKDTHLEYISLVAKAARENGVFPICWDDGGDFKILERSNGKPKTGLWADVLAAMKTAINGATPPTISDEFLNPPTVTKAEIEAFINAHWSEYGYTAKPTKYIALSFDDGPCAASASGGTTALLNALNTAKVKATFFVIGSNVSYNQAAAKAIYDAGHELGNHSNGSDSLGDSPTATITTSLTTTSNLIKAITGKNPTLFRAPNLNHGANLSSVCTTLGMALIDGDAHNDWADPTVPSAETIKNSVLANPQDGGIIILHENNTSQGNTMAALPDIVNGLRQQGFWIMPVSELAIVKGTTLVAGTRYGSISAQPQNFTIDPNMYGEPAAQHGYQKKIAMSELLGSSVTITTGDTFTFTYTFTSNVAIDNLQVVLADTREAAGYWTELSEYVEIGAVTVGTPVTGTKTITATGTAGDATDLANQFVFNIGDTSGATSAPTLKFTVFTLKKN